MAFRSHDHLIYAFKKISIPKLVIKNKKLKLSKSYERNKQNYFART